MQVTCGAKAVQDVKTLLVDGVATVSPSGRRAGTHHPKVTYLPTEAFLASSITRTVELRP